MARRDRPARARADRSARTCAHRPLSRRGRRLQRRRRADRLPRFARARARVPAPAGSARRLRARAERGGGARAPSGGRPAQQGGGDRGLDRAQRLCAAEGAPRPGARRSRLRGRRRFRAARASARRRASQMGERDLSGVVPDQGARGARRAGAPLAPERYGQDFARGTQRRRAARGSEARRVRPDRDQSAVDARRRVGNPAAGACGSCRGRARAPPASIGSPAKSSFATFPQPWISLFLWALALTFRLLWGPGGVTEAVRPLLSPFVNVRPSRRAMGVGGGATTGKGSFPMAMAGTVKFFNAERGYGFIKPDDGGRDVFVHVTAVERAGLKSLTEGQRISFDVEPDKKGKGPKAVNLVITG